MASRMTGVFTPTGSMLEPRYFHNAVRIADLGVLVIAGEGTLEALGSRFDQVAPGTRGCASTTRTMASAEFYHQASGQWSTVAPLPFPRSASGAVVLQSGIVLLTAGSESGQSISDVQLYNVSTHRWTPTGPLHTPRFGHTSTLLASGNVLVVGGNNLQSGAGQVQDSVECYDPLTGHWQRKAWLPVDAMNHTATLLPTGEVLVVGGYSGMQNTTLARAFLYDPTSRRWTERRPLPAPRMQHTATLLADGRVLICGGADEPFGPAQDLAFIYDPVLNSWDRTLMCVPRKDHSATRLATGEVLVVGASSLSQPEQAATAELYDPRSAQWSLTAPLQPGRFGHGACCLSTGQVLIAGGSRATPHPAPLANAELFTLA